MIKHGIGGVLLFAVLPLMAETVRVEDARTALAFDSGRNYLLQELRDKTLKVDHIGAAALDPSVHTLWEITLRNRDGVTERLTPAQAAGASHRLEAGALSIRWTGIKGTRIPSDLSFTLTVTLRGDGAAAWTFRVGGAAAGALWEVTCPRVFAVRDRGDDWLTVPFYLGRLVRDPVKQKQSFDVNYPQSGSMQFFSYWGTPEARSPASSPDTGEDGETGWRPEQSDAAGLYWLAEDPDGYLKQLRAETRSVPGHLSFQAIYIPGLPAWPIPDGAGLRPVDYASPYPVVVRTFTGDYHEAAALYQAWAYRQKWCSAGPLPDALDEPAGGGPDALSRRKPGWFRGIGFWAKFYFEPAKVLPEWAAYREWLRVPVASHYYRYNIARFDDNYPEHLPGDPYLLAGMQAARRMGVYPMPYINGVIWDMDTQSWFRENGRAAAIKDTNGDTIPWDISGEIFAYMCPPTAQWQAKMRETASKQIGEHGMSGVYLDCLASTAARPCYDASHGHPIRGGTYQGEGNRQLMRELRTEVRRLRPDAAFFTEGIGELYLDCMDGFLTLDYARTYLRPGEQVFPVFNVVYNPYVIDFGSDAQIDQPPDAFALQFGTLFTWGCQPLISAQIAAPPRPGDRNSEFLREVVQAYHVAGRAFTQNASWRRVSQRPLGSDMPAGALDVQSAPCRISYDRTGQRRARVWEGPSVIAGAFGKEGRTALLLVNVTGQPQTARVTAGAALFSGRPAAACRRVWPAEAEPLPAGGAQDIALPPGKVAILVYDRDAAAPLPERGTLLDRDWVFARSDNGENFAPAPGRAAELWACDDAAVALAATNGQPSAVLTVPSASGSGLTARTGKRPAQSGPQAERLTLPRRAEEQPFALLRRLPHRLEGEADLVVFSGDAGYLLAKVSPRSALRFAAAKKGVFVTRPLSGKDGAPLFRAGSDSLPLPAGTGELFLGFASLDAACLEDALRVSAAFGIPAEGLAKAWRAMAQSPSLPALAGLNRELRRWVEASSPCPALFAPTGAGTELFRRVQALTAAASRVVPFLLPEDDWLSPGIAKDVPLRFAGDASPDTGGTAVWSAVGNWKPGACAVTPAPQGGARVLLSDHAYVERILPLAAWLPVKTGAEELLPAALTWLEVNRPYELQTQWETVQLTTGMEGSGKVTLRNWSPLPLDVTVRLEGRPGWTVRPVPERLTLAPRESQTVVASILIPEGERGGAAALRVSANHLPEPEAATLGELSLNIVESLSPLAAERAQPGTPRGAAPMIRHNGAYAFFAEKGEAVNLSLTNRRVSAYTDDLKWKLLGPDRKPVKQGTVKVGAQAPVRITAPLTGAYRLDVDVGQGAFQAVSGAHALSEAASEAVTLKLFTSPVKRYFYVPAGSAGFVLTVKDGGETEVAKVTVTSPSGRVVLSRDGNWDATPTPLAVAPGEDGKVWRIECRGVQDVSFWLSGDVSAWLAAEPGAVLRGRR